MYQKKLSRYSIDLQDTLKWNIELDKHLKHTALKIMFIYSVHKL